MNYLTQWDRLCSKNRVLRFINIILKGYSQVLVCPNPLVGLFLFSSIFYLSKTICLLTLIGGTVSTITAFFLRTRIFHIHAGVYGFNGVILGVAWLWFFKISTGAVFLLVIVAAVSSLIMKTLTALSGRTKVNLPVFSIPAVILIWIVVVSLQGWLGEDRIISRYIQSYSYNLFDLKTHFSLDIFLKTFYRHMTAISIILAGIAVHSRRTALISVFAFAQTLILVYCLGKAPEFQYFDLYLYNTIPCAIALAGTFLVFNKRVFLLTILGVGLVVLTTFAGIRYLTVPVFVVPFNFITIFLIWLVKNGVLKKTQGFKAVPMDMVCSPESGLKWQELELYAENYWKNIAADRNIF